MALMPDTSVCRFQIMLQILQNCHEHLYDDELSEEEDKAREDLIALCNEIAKDYIGDDND